MLSIKKLSWMTEFLPNGKNTLVITSCSKKKNSSEKLIKSSDRYIGQMFNATKRFSEDNDYDLLIISAKYGLLRSEEKITNYDQRLTTKKQAIDLRPCVLPKLKKIISENNYSRIIIIMGKLYRYILEELYDFRFIILESTNGIFDYLKKLSELNRAMI